MLSDFTNEATYRDTRVHVSHARTLIPDAYRSEDFYRLEQERVFGRGWVAVGYTSQVSARGEVLPVTVGGQPIIVVRDRVGELRAFYNVCRHRGSILVKEAGCQEVIRCPYHSWVYGTDGKLLRTPYFKGNDVPTAEAAFFDPADAKHFCKDDYGLIPARVGVWGCFVFVSLDPDGMSLEAWLGDLPERYARHPLHELKLVRRARFDIKANWKLVAENFMEYYHLRSIHPELCKVSGVNEHHRYQGPGMYTGMCTSPLTRDPTSPLDRLPVMQGLSDVEATSAYWVLIAPNLALFLLPNHLYTLLLTPEGPMATTEHTDLLVHPDAVQALGADGETTVDAVFDYWDRVNRQDFTAVEGVQRGIAARPYKGGRMCVRFEESIHRFQNIIVDRMVGVERVPDGDHVH